MEKGVSVVLDAVGLIALLAAFVISLIGNGRNQQMLKNLRRLFICVFGMLASDVVYVMLYADAGQSARIGSFIAREVYFAFNTGLVWLWVNYVGHLIWDKDYENRHIHYLLGIAEDTNVALVVINIFVNVLFRIDSDGTFIATLPGMPIYTVLNYLMLTASLIALITNRKRIDRTAFCLLLFFPLLVVISELLAFRFRSIRLVCVYAIAAVSLMDAFRSTSGIKEIDKVIDRALNDGRFQIYYQPMLSLKKNAFTECEALLRLKLEDGTFVSPNEIIAAAEQSGRIGDIYEYVLQSVCDFIGSPTYSTLNLEKVHVNISAAQLSDKSFADRTLNIISKSGVLPIQICGEITESALCTDDLVMERNLGDLSDAGMTFSLDDYGTGYSNVNRILHMNFSVIKLDVAITREIGTERGNSVIESTIGMIGKLGLEAVAEGVETQEQLNFYKRLGCAFVQGFYFTRPLPQKDFTRFLLDSMKKQ